MDYFMDTELNQPHVLALGDEPVNVHVTTTINHERPPKFDGTHPRKWLKKYRQVCSANSWDEKQKLSNLRNSMSESTPADHWFDTKYGDKLPSSMDEFEKSLFADFLDGNETLKKFQEMYERKQLPTESPVAYFFHKMRLMNDLADPISEATKINYINLGLNTQYRDEKTFAATTTDELLALLKLKDFMKSLDDRETNLYPNLAITAPPDHDHSIIAMYQQQNQQQFQSIGHQQGQYQQQNQQMYQQQQQQHQYQHPQQQHYQQNVHTANFQPNRGIRNNFNAAPRETGSYRYQRPYSNHTMVMSRPSQGPLARRQAHFPQRRTPYSGCHNCGGQDHFMRECPYPKVGSNNAIRPRCSYCARHGHTINDCRTKLRAETINTNGPISANTTTDSQSKN